jgi:four helix bundle protein
LNLAEAFVIDIYLTTQSFPREELYGLTAQMRRAAISVAANIFEGCARETIKEYVIFLNVAFSSLRGLRYFLDLSHRLSYVAADKARELEAKYNEAARILSKLISSLRKKC